MFTRCSPDCPFKFNDYTKHWDEDSNVCLLFKNKLTISWLLLEYPVVKDSRCQKYGKIGKRLPLFKRILNKVLSR